MWDPFSFLDDIFGGSGNNSSSVQGSPQANNGFTPVVGWMLGQSFAGAGPIGQYMGMLYGSPGTGIPSVSDVTPQARDSTFARRGGDWGTYQRGDSDYFDRGDYIDFTQKPVFTDAQPVSASDSAPLQPAESRILDTLDRGDGGPAAASGPIDVVHVFGTPPDRRGPDIWWPVSAAYLAAQRRNTVSGGEIQIQWDPPAAPPRARRPAARRRSPADATAPAAPQPERDPGDSGPYFNVEGPPSTVSGSRRDNNPFMSDAPVPQQFLPWGSWDRPERTPPQRPELGNMGRIENVPTVRIERSFWNRGGTGLAAGAVTFAGGVAVLMWWNPVGWAAAAAALGIAGGLAATTASAVELGASYSGATSAEQDAGMNRAVSATLGYSSPGGVIGSVLGTVWADDPQEGFVQGGMVGGLVEGASSLPGALRAVPELWHAAMPWAKSLSLTPLWFFMSARGAGGGGSLARVFTAQGRIATRVRTVEFLGTTPLLERDLDWARFQVFATRTRQEGIYRITYTNGQQRYVLADRSLQGGRSIWEAKESDFGQLLGGPTSARAASETRILDQANTYVDITTVTGGRVGYLVSTQQGATRLTDWFGREFPAQMTSGQLWIDWVPWARSAR